jgi:hypothetical protein
MYADSSGETYIYTCCLTDRTRICGKIFFLALECTKGTSSMDREMEIPSKQVAWGDEKFVITGGESILGTFYHFLPQHVNIKF